MRPLWGGARADPMEALSLILRGSSTSMPTQHGPSCHFGDVSWWPLTSQSFGCLPGAALLSCSNHTYTHTCHTWLS